MLVCLPVSKIDNSIFQLVHRQTLQSFWYTRIFSAPVSNLLSNPVPATFQTDPALTPYPLHHNYSGTRHQHLSPGLLQEPFRNCCCLCFRPTFLVDSQQNRKLLSLRQCFSSDQSPILVSASFRVKTKSFKWPLKPCPMGIPEPLGAHLPLLSLLLRPLTSAVHSTLQAPGLGSWPGCWLWPQGSFPSQPHSCAKTHRDALEPHALLYLSFGLAQHLTCSILKVFVVVSLEARKDVAVGFTALYSSARGLAHNGHWESLFHERTLDLQKDCCRCFMRSG